MKVHLHDDEHSIEYTVQNPEVLKKFALCWDEFEFIEHTTPIRLHVTADPDSVHLELVCWVNEEEIVLGQDYTREDFMWLFP